MGRQQGRQESHKFIPLFDTVHSVGLISLLGSDTPPPAPGTHRRTSLVIPSWSLDIRREGVASCQACGESEGGTWRFNSAVAALPLTPAPSRKYCLSATLENFRTAARVSVVSIISSESCMVCVLGNFPHTRFLVHTCLQQTPPAEATL